MLALDLLVVLLAGVGHLATWIVVVAKVHATGMPWWVIKAFNKLFVVACGSIPLLAAWYWYRAGYPFDRWWLAATPWWLVTYGLACVALALGPVSFWFWGQMLARQSSVLRSNKSQTIDLVARLGHRPVGTSWRAWTTILSFNTVFDLEVNEKRIALPRMDESLTGVTITHLSDLHFDTTLDKSFYAEIVEVANQQQSDIIAVTGDLMEHEMHLDWVPEILGRLTAPSGVFVILGNHDLKLKGQVNRLRQALIDAGLNYLGGRWEELSIGAGRVLLAGNELPWLAPAADVSSYRAYDR